MKRLTASAAALILSLSCVTFPVCEKYFDTSQPTVSASETINSLTVTGTIDYDESYKCLELINEERTAKGLSTLTMDKEFLDMAVQRSAEISLYYEHDHADGGTMKDLFDGMYGTFAENIAYGFNNAQTVTNAWMNSEGHRNNILNSSFKSVGIAYFKSVDGTGFWVQLFQSNSGTDVSKTSTENISVDIDILSDYLDIFAAADDTNDNGTEKQIKIYNKNIISFSLTELSPSDFSYECTTPRTAIVDENGKITVQRKGTVNINITLKSDPSISYTLTFTNNINNVETPQTEHYTVIVDPYSLGDVNGDGLVDSSDASAVLAYYAEISTGGDDYFTSKQKRAGDVNTDNAIDSADASSILSYYSFIATGGNVTMTEFMK